VSADQQTWPEPAAHAAAQLREALGAEPDQVWFAPGRVNLVGEHTDYNEGFVLPLALPFGVGAAIRHRDDALVVVRSAQAEGVVELDVAALEPGSVEGWGGYAAGVAWALREAGHDLVAGGGVDIFLDSDVPSGAGLSSSHALECAVGRALLGHAGLELGATDLAQVVRTAENDYVGAPTGIMDQMASLHGVEGHVLFLDTRTLEVEPVAFDAAAHGLALLVVDTRAPHALVDGEYAERRASCEQGAQALGVPALRDVTVDDLDDALARIEDDVVRRRVRHVVTEDARVLDVVALLRAGGDLREVGPLLSASHASMRDDFEITVPQVDVAAEAAVAAGALGARMTGGGFGGCVIALVEVDATESVAQAVRDAYAEHGFDEPRAFVVTAAAGARRVG
jgi:galactokinase